MSHKLKDYLLVLAFGLFIAAALTLLTGFTRNEIVYRVEIYTVQQNDSLESISAAYIKKNTGTVRYLPEFEQGIREINYKVIGDGEVQPGQVLQIGYWIKK